MFWPGAVLDSRFKARVLTISNFESRNALALEKALFKFKAFVSLLSSTAQSSDQKDSALLQDPPHVYHAIKMSVWHVCNCTVATVLSLDLLSFEAYAAPYTFDAFRVVECACACVQFDNVCSCLFTHMYAIIFFNIIIIIHSLFICRFYSCMRSHVPLTS